MAWVAPLVESRELMASFRLGVCQNFWANSWLSRGKPVQHEWVPDHTVSTPPPDHAERVRRVASGGKRVEMGKYSGVIWALHCLPLPAWRGEGDAYFLIISPVTAPLLGARGNTVLFLGLGYVWEWDWGGISTPIPAKYGIVGKGGGREEVHWGLSQRFTPIFPPKAVPHATFSDSCVHVGCSRGFWVNLCWSLV